MRIGQTRLTRIAPRRGCGQTELAGDPAIVRRLPPDAASAPARTMILYDLTSM